MRILFVLSRVPYPLEKGDKLRAFHLIRELSAQHEILLFCLADTRVHKNAEQALRKYCSEVYIHRIPLLTRLWKLFLAVFSTLPFQVEYFHSAKGQRAFNTFLEAHLPQHIFCQLVRTASYVKDYKLIPKTLDYMDAFSAGMAKMAKSSRFPLSFFMHMEQRRLADYERKVADYFDHHLIISEQDRQCIPIRQRIEVLPNGIDPVFFQEYGSTKKTRDLLFAGNMSYRPNVESARFLVKQVLPLVREAYPDIKLTLAGANPSKAVQSLQSANVEVTGWVDDIRQVYATSRIFVAPMLINSGLQNKLLEAMASHIPCITTSLANNALGAAPGKEILIADEAATMAGSIIALLRDPESGVRIAAAGNAFVTQHYSWPKEASRLASIMGVNAPQ